ncbi:MAG: TIGR01244 family phosphatase [Proteobacteria bacterium]|nr:TIGR01244 family phosphatase [Pseudomonadota bacterium]
MAVLRKWTHTFAFLIAALVGMAGVIGLAWCNKQQSRSAIAHQELVRGVWVTSQVSLEDIRGGKLHGARMLIDLRPDGEAPDQPPSAQVADAARAAGIDFAYIPVAHGAIADEAVTKLRSTLAGQPGPALLYCRSGSRAARTWALGEATDERGLPAATIRDIVARAGFATRDLDADIDARIAARKQGAN